MENLQTLKFNRTFPFLGGSNSKKEIETSGAQRLL